MGNKCCKSNQVAEPQKVAENRAKKISQDNATARDDAQKLIDAQTAEAQREGEKLQGEIKQLEEQIQAKKDAGYERIATGESIKATLNEALEKQAANTENIKAALDKSGSASSQKVASAITTNTNAVTTDQNAPVPAATNA